MMAAELDRPVSPPAAPAAAPRTCPTCRGSRVWRATVGGGYNMPCPTCKGKGYLTELEVAARAAREQRKASKAETAAAAWSEANPAAAAWIQTNAPTGNEFAKAMLMNLQRYGSLTPNMLGAIMRNIERASAPKPVAVALEIPAIEASFAKAKAAGIKRPKMNLDTFTFSPAGPTSANPGAVYVKQGRGEDGVYLGKIMNGKFSRARDCDADTEARIVQAATDPKAAAIAFGKKFGKCSICSRDLSDPASVELGIGPICAGRMGW